MNLLGYLSRIWTAVAHPPSAQTVTARQLHRAQLQKLSAMAAAEDHATESMAYRAQADMLDKRIQRLQQGIAA